MKCPMNIAYTNVLRVVDFYGCSQMMALCVLGHFAILCYYLTKEQVAYSNHPAAHVCVCVCVTVSCVTSVRVCVFWC